MTSTGKKLKDFEKIRFHVTLSKINPTSGFDPTLIPPMPHNHISFNSYIGLLLDMFMWMQKHKRATLFLPNEVINLSR